MITISSKSKDNQIIYRLVVVSILTAISVVVGLGEIIWPLAPWLKLDFSEVIILCSLLIVGYSRTLIVIILRSVIRLLISSHSTVIPFFGFGELVAIIVSILIISIYQLNNIVLRTDDYKISNVKNYKFYLFSLIKLVIVSLLTTAIVVLLNYFIITPSYANGVISIARPSQLKKLEKILKIKDINMYSYFKAIFIIYFPFNIVKLLSNLSIYFILSLGLTKTIDLRTNKDKIDNAKKNEFYVTLNWK